MIKSLARVSLVMSFIALAQPAWARPMVTTFQGVVAADDASGQVLDLAGLFGGGDLEGLPIQAIFSYDTALGSETTDGATFDEIDGGPDYGSNVFTSVEYVINSHSYQFSPDQYQDITTAVVTSGSPGFLSFAAYSSAADVSLVQIETASAPSSLSVPFSAQADPGSVGTLYTYFLPGQSHNGPLDTITFNVTDVTSVAAAPEPSTWLLLIAGFGVIGALLRQMRLGRTERASMRGAVA